ncbi:RNA 2'-phosphotransferase [Mucilaginibacter agri]|uniref:Probable RNA 2'-phosphotransferase n=1 Tax=Mucilaginibacter agri TaxID=2695265 RepID=A0A965ZFR3_9SPHI|nr:RNA 2'-phosphotransferase [Mucilaginibacter agri]NCD68841.1 RNA 2'-phosphotransferase [Mucilaginibacter agri]
MITEKENTQISKFLSLVLRHQPEAIGITLDEQGWVAVDELLNKLTNHGTPITYDALNHIVESNAKKRFAFNEDHTRIRASQGHSVSIELGYSPQIPPVILYHGTGSQSVDAILNSGLDKRNRQHVHLSSDLETAVKVGQRHGKPVVLTVDTMAMHRDGYTFFISENGVWLTDHVPASYLSLKA